MKNMIRTSLIAVLTLFATAGIAAAADLDDLDVSIHVVNQNDDVNEVGHELTLPDSVSESAREHADNEANDQGTENNDAEQSRDEQENQMESNDSSVEDQQSATEEHQDAEEVEQTQTDVESQDTNP